ncbi:MAG TPA: hypothetical protein VJ837_05360 [Candidatus Paceibacterota bacterium]|nr:hypothetical protein [Candidatus Paceibacterota bacterium]
MNGRPCCILGVCCPPGSESQRRALADALAEVVQDAPGGIGERSADRAKADWLLDNFDFAPKGTLTEFKSAIVEMAKKG